jgi:hypothetical protein
MNRLAQPKSDSYAERYRLKYEKELEELKECTFHPTINHRPRRQSGSLPLEERLHHEADNRLVVREKARRLAEKRQIEQHPFKPKINPITKDLLTEEDKAPIYERMDHVQRKRNEERHKLWMQVLQDPHLTFQPEINPRSRVLAKKEKSAFGETHTRKRVVKDPIEEFPFSPQLNPNSERMVPAGRFYDRQISFLEKQLQKAHQSTSSEYSFAPQINTISKMLTAEDRQRETRQERIQRLFAEDWKRKEELHFQQQERFYSQQTFQPEINPISKLIGRSKTVDELASDTSRQAKLEEAIEAAERAFQKAHPFKPALSRRTSMYSKPHLDLKDSSSIIASIEAYYEEKKKKMAALKAQLEKEKMNKCTFQPQVHTQVPNQDDGPVLVAGLAKHLQLKERAKQLEEEKKRKQEEAFKPRNMPKRPALYTIPVPFEFSSSRRNRSSSTLTR